MLFKSAYPLIDLVFVFLYGIKNIHREFDE